MSKLTSTTIIIIVIFLGVTGFVKLNSWANKEADTMITENNQKALEEKRDECATFGGDLDSEGNCQVDEANPIEPQSGKD